MSRTLATPLPAIPEAMPMTESAPHGQASAAEPTIDVRDLDGFMLNVERLLASELWALSTGEEFKAAVGLWCRAWKQIPAGSLPNDERVLASFAGVTVARWAKIRAMAMRGFVLGQDGRWHHQVLCNEARRAFGWKESRRTEREGEATRKRREREDRAAMFESLRGAGVVAEWNISTAELRTLVTKHVRRDGHNPSHGQSRLGQDRTGHVGEGEGDKDTDTEISDVSPENPARARPPRNSPSCLDLSPTWATRHPEMVETILATFRGGSARTIDVLRYFRVKLDSRGQPLEGEWQRETKGQVPEEVALVFMHAPEGAIALPSQYRAARKAFETTEARP